MRALKGPLLQNKIYQEIIKERQEGSVLISGCTHSQKSHLIACMGSGDRCRLVLTSRDERARELYEDLSFFDPRTVLYPSKDILFYQADVRSNQVLKQRMEVLERLRQGEPLLIVAAFDVMMEKLIPFSAILENSFTIDYDSMVDTAAVRLRLEEMGYESSGLVEKPGDYSIRGDILDVFPLTAKLPVRIELWGDEIDSIRSFHTESQRSVENISSVTICPATEIILPKKRIPEAIRQLKAEGEERLSMLRRDKRREAASRLKRLCAAMTEELGGLGRCLQGENLLPYFYEETQCFLDYLPPETEIFIDEPSKTAEHGQAYEMECTLSMANRLEGGYILPRQADIIYGYEETEARLRHKNLTLLYAGLGVPEDFHPAFHHEISARAIPSYNNSLEELKKDLKKWSRQKYKVMMMSSSRTRAERLARDIRDDGLSAFYAKDYERDILPGEVMTAAGRLSAGFEYPELKFVVLTEKDIFKERKSGRVRPQYKGKRLRSLDEIRIGDFVVHEKYGLGIYRGMEKIETEGVARDFINIEYRDASNLFVPASQLELIQKYAGGGNAMPRLNKLGGNEWDRVKTRVHRQVQIAARDLVNLYATRQTGEGFAFSKDTLWQKEFEELFPYEETEDQLLAIRETKKDMESKKIMDRLICGDVGYGKTEVAIRAAFKAVLDSKQVAVLVPTTILAQQHYNTFKERMSHYPIEIAMLSRFCSAGEEKKIKDEIKKGKIDVVIGTHKLLSKTLRFYDLGLLVIDEEQRFGVKQKEKIKQIKKDVDVLSLSATPIPRTLQMSMAGIRDMSLLEIPPVDRRAVQTYVLEYNEEMVREAIERELARGGQVYYVYNKVSDIASVAEKIRKLVPDARVEFGHGRMGERQLEDIMLRFVNRRIDVLVSTTIIETGLDIPNVNTMIIQNAQMFGLAQLYQLRGRVGRSGRTAYAFLMYQRDKQLKEVAEERLKAIREFTDLGSGFKIARRDLEIRGAGNLLGAAQSGHMEAVGYELYCKMLNDAVLELKGGKKEEEIFHTSMDLAVDAYIPSSYVENESQKLALYKRIMLLSNPEEAEDMTEELTDRYGDVPVPVQRLFQVVLLRARAHRVWITAIEQKGDRIRFVMNAHGKFRAEEIDGFLKAFRGKMKLPPAKEPTFIYEAAGIPKKDLLDRVEEIIERIGGLLEPGGEAPAS